jgi:hypothetical protein
MSDLKTLLAFFGHHKCATSWIKAIVAEICNDLSLKFVDVHHPEMFGFDLGGFVAEKEIDFLSYSNAEIQYVKNLSNFLGFHMIRDPRDIVVSAYFSHCYSHPTDNWDALSEYREKLRRVTLDEGLFLEMQFCRQEFEALYNWDYSQRNVLEIKMEDMIASPYETMFQALHHLEIVEENLSLKRKLSYLLSIAADKINTKSKGLVPFRIPRNKLPVDVFLGYVFQNRYSKMSSGRKQGDEDVTSHFRKGVAGDWVNYFNDEHRHYFEQNYGDLVTKLGYEKTWK